MESDFVDEGNRYIFATIFKSAKTTLIRCLPLIFSKRVPSTPWFYCNKNDTGEEGEKPDGVSA
jgi:hypothetical protein